MKLDGLTLSQACDSFDNEYEALNKMRRNNSKELFLKYTASNDHDADFDTNLEESELLTVLVCLNCVMSHRIGMDKDIFVKMMDKSWDYYSKE